jgi:hypothetical protein
LLQQQQKELAARQAVYNQQQLDFITRKNALATQQFDFADKLSSYNLQVKLFNENLEKLEAERAKFQAEQQRHEESVQALAKEKAALKEQKEETESLRQQLTDEHAALQRKIGELQERELALNSRENALKNAAQDLRSRQYAAATYGNSGYGYGYGYTSPATETAYGYQAPVQQRQPEEPYADIRERAQTEGIKLNTAGNMNIGYPTPIPEQRTTQSHEGYYNLGLTLFKSSFIVFCIIVFESLVAFFIKDYLGVSIAYPIVGFSVGFGLFITCAILYASGFKTRARRKKHASYILTAAVIFVIAVILVSMIAVYFKAQVSIPSQLLAFVILPVIYLLNILFFVGFFYLFSKKSHEQNR